METGEYGGGEDGVFSPVDDSEGLYAQIFSYLTFFINIVVMLNLLIAIISDKFAAVMELNLSSDYKELCNLMREVE